ncbi:MAG: BON domain-containing protein [Candidatus Thorarchaeota archaeon]
MKEADEKIEKTIVDQLYEYDGIDISNVEIDVTNRRVTLTGNVPNYTASETALFVAWNTQGVIQVDNKLDIRYPTTAKVPPDPEIEKRVKQTIGWADGLVNQTIQVSVKAGIVSLEGTVDAFWKRLKAEELASHIFGVVKVSTKLAVVPGRKIVDEVIAKNIISALDRSRTVEIDAVSVKVQDGVVTITGTVPDLRAYRSILDFAGRTTGVTDVRSELKIQ